MFRKSLTVAGSLFLASMSLHAVEPASGIWWNSSESGRGFTFDYQNGFLVVTGFVYNSDGSSTFVQAAGPFNTQQSHFSAQLYSDSGGQCLGCAYRAPTSTNIGTLSLDFTSAEAARITYPEGSENIEHEVYGYADKQSYLYGEWSFEYQLLGTVFAQWVVFDSTYTSGGVTYIKGYEDQLSSSTIALGTLSNGTFIVIAGDSNFSTIYDFPVSDDRRMIGEGEIYSTGGTVPVPNNIAVGSRLLSQAEISQSSSTNPAEYFSIPAYEPNPLLEQFAAAIQAHIH